MERRPWNAQNNNFDFAIVKVGWKQNLTHSQFCDLQKTYLLPHIQFCVCQKLSTLKYLR
jgi:hypothetical protein